MASKKRRTKAGFARNRKTAPGRIAGRKCAECTACCHVLGARGHGPWGERDKRPWEDCPERIEGTGCAIHASRPQGCRPFRCAWLQGVSFMKERHRPDRCGFIISGVAGQAGMIQMWVFRDGAERTPEGIEIGTFLNNRGINVIVRRPGEQNTVVTVDRQEAPTETPDET
jgi:hypothetical protein